MSKSRVVFLAFLVSLSCAAFPVWGQMVMERTVTGLDENGWLIPGTTSLSFTVSMSYSGDAVTALAVEERIPAGWSLSSTTGPCVANLTPPAGTETTLQFVWFAIPSFPCEFGYTLNVAAGETGPVTVEGEVEYRTGGGALFSNTVVTTIELEPTAIAFTRSLSGDGLSGSSGQFYIPGQPITVEVTLTKTGQKAVTALSFSDTVPAGWAFESVGGANPPNLGPAAGDTGPGPLEFVWFAIPSFPASFSYVITPPADADAEGCFEGIVEFRTDGGAEFSPADLVCLDAQPCMSFSRGGDSFYSPGAQVSISVTLESSCTDAITALALQETVPAGWEFVSASGPGAPNLSPPAGTAGPGPLEFVWFSIPVFPATFTYVLEVPLDESALTASITGKVLYRLGGGQLETDVVETPLSGEDTTDPTALCQDVTVNLDASGAATVTAAQVDNGSTDDRGSVTLSLSQTDFTCADLGANTVTLTVTDGNNNTATCDAVVTVVDNLLPTALCQDVTVNLNASGAATVTAAQVNNGSADNCGVASLTLSQTSFTCADVGANTVTLTVTDDSGNTAQCTATVTVLDVTAPVALCKDVSVNLSASGTASVTAAQVDNGSSDNCGSVDLALDQTAFTCADVGANTVTLTVTDDSGNAATCAATVTVLDVTAPLVSCQDATVQLDGSGTATVTAAQLVSGSSDNCDTAVALSVSPSNFTCAELGANAVTVTAVDDAGNAATCAATVTVEDGAAPVITLLGSALVEVECGDAYSDAGATALDNCDGDLTASIAQSGSVNADAPGTYTLSYNVTDSAGNAAATVTRVVEVLDTQPPVITVLGANPLETDCDCSGAYSDAGATAQDACAGAVSVTATGADSVDLATAGTYTVTYAAVDDAGNTATATRTVVVSGDTCAYCACEIVTVTLTSPAWDRKIVPAGSVVVETLTSQVELSGPCGAEVEYMVDGVVVGSSTDGANGYPVEVTLAPSASPQLITATVRIAESGAEAVAEKQVVVRVGRDDNGDGYLDDPFEDLPEEGDTWGATVDSTNCQRAVAMVTWFGGGDGVVTATVSNPEDPTQTAVVTAPRALLAAGEQGVLIASIACDLPSLVAPYPATELLEDLPDGEVAGAAYVEVSVIVSGDGGATFDEVDPALVAGSPVTVSLSGLAFTPGLAATFYSHPTFVNGTDAGVVLEPEAGAWSKAGVQNVTHTGGVLTAETTTLSVFGPFEEVALPPTLKVTPNPAFDRIVGIVPVGESVDVTYTVKNVGSGTVSGGATLSDSSGSFTLVGQTTYSLATNATRQITVRFTPKSEADYTATVTFTGGVAPVTATLRGTGTAAAKWCCLLGCGAGTGATGGYGDLAVVLALALGVAVLPRVRRARQD